jgi:hypothetical protein
MDREMGEDGMKPVGYDMIVLLMLHSPLGVQIC